MSAASVRPRGLVLDFGGVIVSTRPRPGWSEAMTAHVTAVLESEETRSGLDAERIEADLLDATRAHHAWKMSMSRPWGPTEMGPAEYFGELVAGDWPEPARDSVVAHAAELARLLGVLRQERIDREGIRELLVFCRQAGIAVAVASNALSGQVHRDHLAEHGLTELVGPQIYSDEAGVRKPNPALIERAAAALGLSPAQVWYVGDTHDRDVVAGRRAGAGAVVVMHDGEDVVPYRRHERPDLEVADPVGLLEVLRAAGTAGDDASTTGVAGKDATGEDTAGAPTPAVLLRIVREAAAQVTDHLRGIDPNAAARDHKRDHRDIVTVHDRHCEDLIRRVLRGAFPDSRVVGEERGTDGPPAHRSQVTFIVDPIDGTSNFAAGSPLYCVSIAAQLRGRTCAAVVAMPALGIQVFGDDRTVHVQRLPAGTPRRAGGPVLRGAQECVVATGFPSARDLAADAEASLRHYGYLLEAVGQVRSLGAGALELALVAAGQLDAAFGVRTSPWDIAAGLHLVAVAGGRVAHFAMDGDPRAEPLDQPGYLAVAPGRQLDVLDALLARIQADRRRRAQERAAATGRIGSGRSLA